MNIKCPICNNEITIKKKWESSGMDGSYQDWDCYCNNCRMFHAVFAADNFYGRKYCKTIEEVNDLLSAQLSMYNTQK